MKNKNDDEKPITIRELTIMTSKRLRQLDSQKEATAGMIQTAKSQGTLVNAFLAPIRTAIQVAKMTGSPIDLAYIGIAGPKQIEAPEKTQ